MFLTPILIILSTLCITYAKVYERCELARELRNFDLPEDEIPTWVCIAQHESNFNTSAMNPGSGDHGLFQISQIYWCSPPGTGYGCNSPCSKFRDDDIADDLQCIRRIYNEHTRISGDGFNAWVVYPLYCKNDNSKYINSCFDQDTFTIPAISANATENEIPGEEGDEYGDGYQFPPLPTISKSDQQNLSKALDVGDRYGFLKLPFSRTSIHDSVPVVKGTKYNFPDFPYSKESIHEFIPVHRPSDETVHNQEVKQETNEFYVRPVFSKYSIHHFIPVSITPKDNLIHVPQKTEDVKSKDYFSPMSEISGNTDGLSIQELIPIIKLPVTLGTRTSTAGADVYEFSVSSGSSKHPVYHFVSTEASVMNVDTESDKEESEYNFPPLPRIFEKINQSKPPQNNEVITDSNLNSKLTTLTSLKKSSSTSTTSQPISQSPKPFIRSSQGGTKFTSTLKPSILTTAFLTKPDKQFFMTTTQQSFTKDLISASFNPFSIKNYLITKKPSIFTEKEKSGYDFPLLLNNESKSLETNKIQDTTKSKDLKLSSKLTTLKSFTKLYSISTSKPVTTLHSVTSKSFTVSSQNSSTEVSSTLKLPISTSLKPYFTPHYFVTKKPFMFTKKLFTTTSQPFTRRSILNNTTIKQVPVQSFISSTTPVPTNLHPLISASKLNFSAFTAKSLLNSLKTFTTTPRSLTKPSDLREKKPAKYNLEGNDLLTASSTLRPFTALKPLTTTFKPLLNSKQLTTMSSPFVNQKTFFNSFNKLTTILDPTSMSKSYTRMAYTPTTTESTPFTLSSQKTNDVPMALGTKQPFIFQSFSTSKPLLNFTPKSFTTSAPKQLYTITSRPLTKQVTFAPDSFLSWIFGSQTLPPLVPPGRPPRPPRPSGGLPPPSLNQRPRPGGLPRPPRPERPGGIRPMIPDGLSEPFIRRPFGERPTSSLQSFATHQRSGGVQSTKKSLFKEKTERSTAITMELFSTSTSKTLVPTDVTSLQQQISRFGIVRQLPSNVYRNNSSALKTPPSESSKFKPDIDDFAVEVKLDDNFVFLRTRFGYRLFRNVKN